MVPLGGQENRTACRTHARVNHYHVYRSAREIRIRLGDRQRTVEHIKSLHSVAYVNNFRFRNNAQNYTFYGSDVMVIEPEIGGQSNDRPVRQAHLFAVWNLSRNSKVTCGGKHRQGTEVIGTHAFCWSLRSLRRFSAVSAF